ncbi:MAG: CPBP family intramembrane metalloprotease [Bacteroidetes bacterium]|nr:CPBP family intramembrane metalloprotease [Bacteroidota bacterium]
MDNPIATDPFQPASPEPRPVLDGSEAPVTAYLRLSRTWTYSYLFVLPLFLFYEIGIRLANAGSTMEVRVSADVFVKRLLGMVGIDSTLWLSALLVALGAGIVLYERRHHIPVRPRYFAWMFGESLAYGLVIGMIVAWFVAELFSLVWPPLLQMAGRVGTMRSVVLSLGAGVYEELVFRLLLVSAFVWLLKLARGLKQRQRYAIAAIVGALIFSAVHYIGSLGDTFTIPSFTFRFLMGLVLNLLFLWRGFGIAAMTHALYDVIFTLMH